MTYSLFVLPLIAPEFPTVGAPDQPATVSPAVPVTDGDIAVGTTAEFNMARPPEPRGPEGEAEIWIPRSKRWRVHWTPTDLQDYARQLDYFKIELAVAGGDKPLLDYVSNVTKPRPDSRQGAGAAEKRLCMTWSRKEGKLVDLDKEILSRAGIPTTNRTLLQFYPAEVEDILAFVEMDNARRKGHKHLEEFRMTTFGVRPIRKGYELYVENQEFR